MTDNKLSEVLKEFPVTIFGKLTPINDTLSLARVRIFYKGANRNGTFITEEFVEKLIPTLPYTPIKGIYSKIDEDFSDHGKNRDDGRAYGVVPENPNFAWETHLDEDGVEREYACADVYIWTALYDEAKDIIGKAQSMELYEPSILGEWKFIQGRRFFVYTEGSFLGLQVLGSPVEPCFEGAAFFSLYQSLKGMVDEIKQFNLSSQKEKGGDENTMDMIFKLSNEEKSSLLFSALNPDDSASLYPVATYDNYVIAHNYKDNQFFKIQYTVNEKEEVTLGDREEVFAEFVSKPELDALTALRGMNNGTFEAIDTNYSTLTVANEELTTKNSEFSQKIEEQEGTIATLTTEKETVETSLHTATDKVTELEEKVSTLHSLEADRIKSEKEAIITQYSEQLSEEVIAEFTAKIDDYTVAELDEKLAYTLVKSKPNLFSLDNSNYVPKDGAPKEGIESILDKYKK